MEWKLELCSFVVASCNKETEQLIADCGPALSVVLQEERIEINKKNLSPRCIFVDGIKLLCVATDRSCYSMCVCVQLGGKESRN